MHIGRRHGIRTRGVGHAHSAFGSASTGRAAACPRLFRPRAQVGPRGPYSIVEPGGLPIVSMGAVAWLDPCQRARADRCMLGKRCPVGYYYYCCCRRPCIRPRVHLAPPAHAQVRPLAAHLMRTNLYSAGHCVNLAKSADYTLPVPELRHLATAAHSRLASDVASFVRPGSARQAALAAVPAPSIAETGTMAVPQCKTALVLGVDAIELLIEGSRSSRSSRIEPTELTEGSRRPAGKRHRSYVLPAANELGRYLRALGLCPRLLERTGIQLGTHPLAAHLENASLVIRFAGGADGSIRWRLRRDAVQIDLVGPLTNLGHLDTFGHLFYFCQPPTSATNSSVHTVDGISTTPLEVQQQDRCVVPLRYLELLLRTAQAKMHPHEDVASVYMGSLWNPADMLRAGGAARDLACECRQ